MELRIEKKTTANVVFKFLLTLLLFTNNFSFGQKTEVKNNLLDKTLKKDSVIAEFTELYNLTNTIHPGQFMFCSKNEFDKTFLSLKNSINSDLSIVEYFKLTATLMAKIKDGHTAVDRTQIISLLNERLVFPFSIYKIRDNYYLGKSTEGKKDYLGLKILKINRQDIHSVLNEIQKYIHLEARNETGLNTRLKNFPFYYFIYNQTEHFTIEYLDINKKKKTISLQGVSYETFTKYINEHIEPLSTEFRDNETAILKFHSFENSYNEADRKIAETQLDNFFNRLDSLKIQNLIIDLRDNSGGAPEIANYLFSYLVNKPYYYFDYVGAKFTSVKEWKHYAQYPDNIQEINIAETTLKNGLYH
ncbi:MAG: peptidase S41 [Sphingobacteriales bacterium]|nr:peptidase S41 [Sphingobacteriales bacterium]